MRRIFVIVALSMGSVPDRSEARFSNGGVIASFDETFVPFHGVDWSLNLARLEAYGIFEFGASYEVQASLIYENRHFRFYENIDDTGFAGEVYALYRISDHSRVGVFYANAFQWNTSFNDDTFGIIYEYQRGPFAVEVAAAHTPDILDFDSLDDTAISILIEYEWQSLTASAYHQEMTADFQGLRRSGARLSYATGLLNDMDIFVEYSAISGSLNNTTNEYWEVGIEFPFGNGDKRRIRSPRF